MGHPVYEKTTAEVQINGRITEEFEAEKGVRQGCALSSILFDLYIDDIDEEWDKNDQGGVVVGKHKIRVLKYADDIAIVAETAKELERMLKSTEKYVDKNELTVNVKKTKIMVFRNGGKRVRDEKWRFKEEDIQVVNDFKYLGYLFTTRNSCVKHKQLLAGRAQKAANTTWGVMKRAGRDRARERLKLMNSLVRSVAMHGVKIWGWGDCALLNKMQGRYCKMTLGVAKNTPSYIWRRELDVLEIKYIVRERACRYIKNVLSMEDNRWPKICLREEMRALLNNSPTKWGNEVAKVLIEIWCEDISEKIWRGENSDEIYESLKKGLELWHEGLRREEWEAIVKPTFNREYRMIIGGVNCTTYLNQRNKNKAHKEVWARIRCGNVGRAQKKGYMEWGCRLCGTKEESLAHLFCCGSTTDVQKKETLAFLNNWRGNRDEAEVRELLREVLRGELVEELCDYVIGVEKKLKESCGRF